MLSDIDHKIIHEVALDHFVRDNVVEDVILSIEHNVAKVIESADVHNDNVPIINLTNFGKFVVSIKRRSSLKRQHDKRNKDINEGQEGDCEGSCDDTAVDCVE